MRCLLVIIILFLLAPGARCVAASNLSMILDTRFEKGVEPFEWYVGAQDFARLRTIDCILTYEDFENSIKPHPIFNFLRQKKKSSRKLTAAVLAFPFPFGIVGLHRIFLGTAPYVPIVYIATAGGVFGLLPLIDFIAIVAEKDLTRFSGNRQVFMWVE